MGDLQACWMNGLAAKSGTVKRDVESNDAIAVPVMIDDYIRPLETLLVQYYTSPDDSNVLYRHEDGEVWPFLSIVW